MPRIARTLAAWALAATLAALAGCATHRPPKWHPHPRPRPAPVAPAPAAPAPAPAQAPVPAPAAAPTPREIAAERLHQVDGRIESLGHRIDEHVSHGDYPLAQGAALHHRLEEIHKEAHDIASQHGDGLTPDEQGVMNEELDTAAHAANE